jgi:hypothetical protein
MKNLLVPTLLFITLCAPAMAKEEAAAAQPSASVTLSFDQMRTIEQALDAAAGDCKTDTNACVIGLKRVEIDKILNDAAAAVAKVK